MSTPFPRAELAHSESASKHVNLQQEHQAALNLHEAAFSAAPKGCEKPAVSSELGENKSQQAPGFDKAANILEKFFAQHAMDVGWNRPSNLLLQEPWMIRSQQAMQVVTEMDKCLTTIDELNKLGGDFSSAALENLPPGWTLNKEEKTGKLKIHGALPETWQATPENDAKLQAMTNWVTKCGDEIRKAVANFGEKGAGIIRYGDFRHSGKVDVNGEKQNFDLVTYKYSAEKETDGSIKLTTTKEFAKDHLLNYNNWFSSTLASESQERHYAPNDLVPMQSTSGEITLVRAEKLASLFNKAWSGFKHHGWKTATAAMDIGMTVSGGVGLKAAYVAGSRGYMAWNATKLALGASGALTPAIEQGVLPEWIQTARHCGFLGVVGIETAAHLPFLGGRVSAAGASLVPLTIEQAKTIETLAKASKSLQVAELGMRAAVPPMVTMLAEDSISINRLRQNNGKPSAKVLRDAKRLAH